MSTLPACSKPVSGAERVLQFGEGNFLRAFVDWIFFQARNKGKFDGKIVIAQPLPQGMCAELNAQDCRYTVMLRGIEDGIERKSIDIIEGVSRAINPYTDWGEIRKLAQSPDLRYIVSNTTEAGICWKEEDFDAANCPDSFPAKVTSLLYARWQAKQRGLVFLPCELSDRNGDHLREYVLKHADKWNLPDIFVDWIKQQCLFCNTLVDRIVPGFPKNEIEQIYTELGYTDKMIVTGEFFHLWVIEAPLWLESELPLNQVPGLNVVFTTDLEPYRTRKVRVLNGAHTSSVLAARLAGLETVGEMMADADFSKYVFSTVRQEILPILPLPIDERIRFADAVMDRFRNPFIRHLLIDISLNSTSKWSVRVLPSLKEYIQLTAMLPRRLVFSLAALLRFYKCTADANGNYRGQAEDSEYPVKDSAAVLTFFADLWAKNTDPQVITDKALANTSLWGEDLTKIPGLSACTAKYLVEILASGTRVVAKNL